MTTAWYPRCEAVLVPVFDGYAQNKDKAALGVAVTPLHATVLLNDYNHPDTWSLEFDSKALPFEPGQLRELAVAIHMYSAKTLDEPFSAQMNNSTLMVEGIAESMTLDLSSSGRVFSCSGGDYTTLLARVPWSGELVSKEQAKASRFKKKEFKKQLKPNGRSILEMVQGLVDELPGASLLTVRYEGPQPIPVIERPPMTIKKGMTYWNVIYQLVLENNLVCFVRGEDLVITSYVKERERLYHDANADQVGPLGSSHGARSPAPSMRFMEWGRNIDKLTINREIGGKQVPQQVFDMYDPKTRRSTRVFYPEKNEKVTVGIGTDFTHQTLVTGLPPGIDTVEKVRAALRAKYDYEARGELSFTFSTSDLEDLWGRDLLQGLRPASAVSLGFDKFGVENSMIGASLEERKRIMRSKGFKENVATLVAESYEKIEQLRRPLYVSETSFTWDIESGLKVDKCKCINFASLARDEGAEIAA